MKKSPAPPQSRVWLAGVHPRLAVAMVVFAVIGAIVVAAWMLDSVDTALTAHIRAVSRAEANKAIQEFSSRYPTTGSDCWGVTGSDAIRPTRGTVTSCDEPGGCSSGFICDAGGCYPASANPWIRGNAPK